MSYECLNPGKCCRARLCEKPDPLNALGSVAGYLRNSQFFRINDKSWLCARQNGYTEIGKRA